MFHFLVQETNVTHVLQVEREDDVKTLYVLLLKDMRGEEEEIVTCIIIAFGYSLFYYAQIHTQSAIIE